MPDTKEGREEQARHEDRRQRQRDLEEPADGTRPCHRRNCDRPAAFRVLERYLEDTGHGAVEATAELCREHTAEESPTRLDDAYRDYVFRVEPLPGAVTAEEP
jgi:hypothetical protein